MDTNRSIVIRDLAPGDEPDFRRLNEEWITRYFVLEPKDLETIGHPRENILDAGGRVFLAFDGDTAVGCCALTVHGPGEFEVAKMAVTESYRRAGIGRKLLENSIAEADAGGAKRLYLETNHVLTGAIRLYESAGFRHVPPEKVVPSPYARADVFMERPGMEQT
jgi:ribosomal protein S18 acetylase RimI-like enzyme